MNATACKSMWELGGTESIRIRQHHSLLVMVVDEFGQDAVFEAVVHGLAYGGIQGHVFPLIAGFYLVDKKAVVVEKRAFLEDGAVGSVSDVEHSDRRDCPTVITHDNPFA